MDEIDMMIEYRESKKLVSKVKLLFLVSEDKIRQLSREINAELQIIQSGDSFYYLVEGRKYIYRTNEDNIADPNQLTRIYNKKLVKANLY